MDSREQQKLMRGADGDHELNAQAELALLLYSGTTYQRSKLQYHLDRHFHSEDLSDRVIRPLLLSQGKCHSL
jgi:hypothetical protein